LSQTAGDECLLRLSKLVDIGHKITDAITSNDVGALRSLVEHQHDLCVEVESLMAEGPLPSSADGLLAELKRLHVLNRDLLRTCLEMTGFMIDVLKNAMTGSGKTIYCQGQTGKAVFEQQIGAKPRLVNRQA